MSLSGVARVMLPWVLLIAYGLLGLVLLTRVADHFQEKAPLVALVILWFGVGVYEVAQWAMGAV